MSDVVFDVTLTGMDRFTKELDDLERLFPREARRLMLRSGSRARTIVARKARQLVRKVTGNYVKSIKRGKVWKDEKTGEYKVRVYSRANHAHWVEYGHRIVTKAGEERGFAEGFHVFEKATKEIEDEWTGIIEKEFDRIMAKI